VIHSKTRKVIKTALFTHCTLVACKLTAKVQRYYARPFITKRLPNHFVTDCTDWQSKTGSTLNCFIIDAEICRCAPTRTYDYRLLHDHAE
jgi:hypothetical protein